MKKLIFTILVSLAIKGFSQCQPVCIVGSASVTIAPTTTLNVHVVPSGTAAVTYSYVTSSGTNTITAGYKTISVANVGGASAQFNGTTLPAGATINLQVPSMYLPSVTYNCLTSILMVYLSK
jgi:hypothetical protein